MAQEVKFFDYPLQFKEFEREYMQIIEETLTRGHYILGPDLEVFEGGFAEYVGSRYAVGVGNGTDAILLALYAAGIGQGDEVISVSHTFVATIEAIHFLGAEPVLVDITEDHNMDIEQVEAAITPLTKAVIPVQLNGRVCSKMDRLTRITAKHDITLIEDAAQAIGARYKGRLAGTFGLAGCFSFYPAKVLGAFGDAGAIVTDDDDLANRLRMIRNHGRGVHGSVETWGFNSRMDNIQAAILNQRLSRLDSWVERRREIAGLYSNGLADMEGLNLPPAPEDDSDHFDVYQNYEIEAENRDELTEFLKGKGIETAVQWGGKGVHQFQALGFKDVVLPRTEEFFKKALMLPIYPSLKDEQVEYVISAMREFYGK